MSKKENHQPCPMIADKRSIGINPLATDPAKTRTQNLSVFHYLFSFCSLFLDPPGGIQKLQKLFTLYEHQSWWTGRDLNPRPSGHSRRIFPMRTGRSTAQAAHDRPAYQAELPAQPNKRPSQKPSKRL